MKLDINLISFWNELLSRGALVERGKDKKPIHSLNKRILIKDIKEIESILIENKYELR
jgi:hypothetical protein